MLQLEYIAVELDDVSKTITKPTQTECENYYQRNIGQFKKFFSEMLNRCIYLAPSAYEAMFVSLAHSAEDIEKTVRAAQESFQKINFS